MTASPGSWARSPVGRTGGSFVVGPKGGIVIAPTADRRSLRARARRRGDGGRRAGRRPARGRARTSRRRSGSRSMAPATRSPSRPCGSRAGSSRSSSPRPSSWPRSTAPSACWRSASPCSCSPPARWSPPAPGASWPTRSPASPRICGHRALRARGHRRTGPRAWPRSTGCRPPSPAWPPGLADFAKFIPTELVRRLLAERRARRARRRAARAHRPVRRPRRLHRPERAPGRRAWSPIVGQFLELASPGGRGRGRHGRQVSSATPSWPSGVPRRPTPTRRCTPAAPRSRIEAGMRAAAGRGEPLGELRVRIGLAHRPRHRRQCRLHAPPQLHRPGRHREPRLAPGGGEQGLRHHDPASPPPPGRPPATRIATREIDTVAVYGRSEGVRLFELTGLAGDTDPPATPATPRPWPSTAPPASPRPPPCSPSPARRRPDPLARRPLHRPGRRPTAAAGSPSPTST